MPVWRWLGLMCIYWHWLKTNIQWRSFCFWLHTNSNTICSCVQLREKKKRVAGPSLVNLPSVSSLFQCSLIQHVSVSAVRGWNGDLINLLTGSHLQAADKIIIFWSIYHMVTLQNKKENVVTRVRCLNSTFLSSEASMNVWRWIINTPWQ